MTVDEPSVSSRFFWTSLTAIVFLAAATRFYHLGYESLWLDEAITFARSRLELPKLIDNAIRRYHNPTYFILIHYVMTFGDSEFVLRMPSAVAGIVKTFAVCGLGCLVGGRRLGLLSALFVLLLPSQLKYDQEARMYGLLGLSTTVTLCCLFWILTHNLAATNPLWGSKNAITTTPHHHARTAWSLYAIGAIVSLYLHNAATLFVAICAFALFCGWFESKKRLAFAKNWFIAHAAVAVGFLPWVPVLFDQNNKMQATGWWATEPDAATTLNTLSDLYGIGGNARWFLLLTIASAIYGAFRLRKRRATVAALVILAVGGPIALALVTLYQPMFMLRLMLWSAIPFTILVANSVLAIRSRLLTRGIVTLSIALGLLHFNRNYYEVRQKPDWNSAVEQLVQKTEPKDVILATGGAEARSLYYYLNRKHRKLPSLTIAFNIDRMAKDIEPFLKGDTRTVWLIRARERPQTVRINEQLLKLASRISSRQFGPELVIERYQMNSFANVVQ